MCLEQLRLFQPSHDLQQVILSFFHGGDDLEESDLFLLDGYGWRWWRGGRLREETWKVIHRRREVSFCAYFWWSEIGICCAIMTVISHVVSLLEPQTEKRGEKWEMRTSTTSFLPQPHPTTLLCRRLLFKQQKNWSSCLSSPLSAWVS